MMILKTSRANLSSNDQLSLDLPFAATKSLTARVGPTPVFTRSSGDNGGTTYFGPLVDFELVDFGEITAFSTTGISNGRASWFKSYEGIDITISYSGTRWRVVIVDNGDEVTYLAAPGSEWRPDQADWSSQEFTITTSSTFGIVKAANNEPRFDHTSAGVCRGLLIEESRTNLTVRSDDFGASEWNAALQRNLTVTANNTTSPSGATDADLLKVGATTTVYQVLQALPSTGNVTSGTAYTVSCFFKPNQVTRVSIWAGNPVTLPVDAMFDLTGAGSVVASAYGTASIQQYPNGWYRCIITGTAGATSNTSLRISPVSGTSRTYAGNSVDSFWAWGAQLEAGSFPTSYIPTTTGTLARGADVCSITGANFTSFYNQSEGTMLTNAFTPASGDRTVLAADDNTANEMIRLRTEGTNPFFKVTDGGSELVAIDAGTVSANTSFKLIGAYKLDDFASSINGGAAVTDTSGTTPTVDRMRIGAGQGGNTMCGCVASLRYYRKRLPDAKLQALTA